MCLCFIMPVMQRHGRCKRLGTCLVVKPYASCVVSLQHVSIFHYTGGARAWMMQAPWYLTCGEAAYVMWRCCCCFLKSLNCT